ncbi:MAG TPA: AsmA family protein [Eoetvoesiella sp.]
MGLFTIVGPDYNEFQTRSNGGFMPRYAKITIWLLSALLLCLALCVVLLVNFNWNHAKPWLSEYASEMVDRPVDIHGNLSVQWLKPSTQVETGWRKWVRWPQLTAEQVTIGNPAWSTDTKNMAEVRRLVVSLNLLALLDKTIQIPRLELQGANVFLERQSDTKNNWTFTKANASAAPPSWKFELGKLVLQQVNVQVTDTVSNLKLKADVNNLKELTSEGYGIGWKATGSYNEAQLSGEGRAGEFLSLRNSNNPFPFDGNVKVGETVIAVQGSVTRPQALAALDVQLKLQGATMSDLFPLIGVALPNTPPYSTEGRLIGRLDEAVDTWRYEDFKGKVGSSDVEGTLEFLRKKPRSLLKGEVRSTLLRFADLGPLVGVDPRIEKKGNKKVKQPADKVLPVVPIHTAIWGVMDADVKFTGQKIVHDKRLPIEDVRANIKLNDSILTLTPLNFGVAGGELSSNITLNGQGEIIKAKMAISARHLQLKKLFPGAESMKASFGELHGDAALTSEGNSVAQLLGKSTGEVQALVSKGTISHFLLEAAGLNIANLVMLKIFGDEQVVLNCLASDFSVKNGLMQVRVFQLDTQDAVVSMTGQINLATEQLALDVKPENKTLRVFTLRSPLYVKGTFKDPDVGVYTGALAARAGGAVALGLIATPFAALLPLLNLGKGDTNECGELFKAMSKKPGASEGKAGKPADTVQGSVSGKDEGRVKGSVSGKTPVTN